MTTIWLMLEVYGILLMYHCLNSPNVREHLIYWSNICLHVYETTNPSVAAFIDCISSFCGGTLYCLSKMS